MKEIKSIIEAYNEIDFSKHKAALATVSRVEGSSYRRAGARMLVVDNGTYLGGISGGCLEGDALRRAQKAIVQDKPSIITYDTTQDDGAQIGVGLGCNGIIDVLFTPLQKNDVNNPVEQLAKLTGTREPRIIVAITGTDDKELLGRSFVYESGDAFRNIFPLVSVTDHLLHDIEECFYKQASSTVFYEDINTRVFIEVLLPVTHLVLFGGNYDIYPMARCAGELGWNITVVMNKQKASKQLFTEGITVIDNKSGDMPATDRHTAAILMAHDYKTDLANLQNILQTNCRYIGMLGPRKRSRKMFDALAAENKGIGDTDMERIFAPAGLDIGAATPEEIALAICAEIRSVFAGRNGQSLRLRQGTIYGN